MQFSSCAVITGRIIIHLTADNIKKNQTHNRLISEKQAVNPRLLDHYNGIGRATPATAPIIILLKLYVTKAAGEDSLAAFCHDACSGAARLKPVARFLPFINSIINDFTVKIV